MKAITGCEIFNCTDFRDDLCTYEGTTCKYREESEKAQRYDSLYSQLKGWKVEVRSCPTCKGLKIDCPDCNGTGIILRDLKPEDLQFNDICKDSITNTLLTIPTVTVKGERIVREQ